MFSIKIIDLENIGKTLIETLEKKKKYFQRIKEQAK